MTKSITRPKEKGLLFQILIVFFFIYEVQPLGVPDLLTSRKIVFYIVAILYIIQVGFSLKNVRPNKIAYKSIKNLFSLSIAFLTWAFLLHLLLDPAGTRSIIQRSILLIPYTGFLYTFVYERFDNEQQFFKALFWATIIQSVIVIAHFFDDSVKMFLYLNFQLDANGTYLHTERAMGLGAGGSLLSVNLFLGLIGAAYFIVKGKNTILYVAGYILILFSCLLSGSTGFVAGVGLLICVGIYLSFIKRSFNIIFVVFGLFIGVQVLLSFASNFFSEIEDFQIFRKVSEFWTVGAKESSVVTSLQAQKVAPICLETLIGTSLYRGEYNGIINSSDTGYFQNYFGYGLIGVVVFYFTLYRIMLTNLFKIHGKDVFVVLLYLFVIILLGEGKEPYIHHYGNIFVFFMACFLISKKEIYEAYEK